MNLACRTLLAGLPLLLVATPVLAQPGPDAPPPGADGSQATPATPATQAPGQVWNGVSNINGQLVPVGKHNEYLYKFRRFNLSSNPIGWLAGFYGVSASYAITDHIALRADVNIFNSVFGSDTSGYEVGISAPIYLRRTYQGPFIEPGLIARGWSYAGDEQNTTTGVGPEMLVGYQVMFDSGLNMAAAVGLAKLSNSEDQSSDLEPTGYFRVGYAF